MECWGVEKIKPEVQSFFHYANTPIDFQINCGGRKKLHLQRSTHPQ
jgi:hypothetical protein